MPKIQLALGAKINAFLLSRLLFIQITINWSELYHFDV